MPDNYLKIYQHKYQMKEHHIGFQVWYFFSLSFSCLIMLQEKMYVFGFGFNDLLSSIASYFVLGWS